MSTRKPKLSPEAQKQKRAHELLKQTDLILGAMPLDNTPKELMNLWKRVHDYLYPATASGTKSIAKAATPKISTAKVRVPKPKTTDSNGPRNR